VHGFDQAAGVPELAAQAGNLDVDGAVRHRVIRSLHRIDDLRPREHPPRVPGEKVEEREFGAGEVHRPAADPHFIPGRIDGQVADFQHRRNVRDPLRPAPQDAPDPGREHLGTERLDDVILGAQLEPGHDVRILALCGEHDHRHAGRAGFTLERPAHVEAADARQHQIEQDQVRRIHRRRTERVLPRGRALHHKAFLLEVEPDQFPDVLFVLDREYAGTRHGGSPYLWTVSFIVADRPAERIRNR
jgi:hypothetical protein